MDALFLALDIATSGTNLANTLTSSQQNSNNQSAPFSQPRAILESIFKDLELAQNMVTQEIITEDTYNSYKIEYKQMVQNWLNKKPGSSLSVYTIQEHLTFQSVKERDKENENAFSTILLCIGLTLLMVWIIYFYIL